MPRKGKSLSWLRNIDTKKVRWLIIIFSWEAKVGIEGRGCVSSGSPREHPHYLSYFCSQLLSPAVSQKVATASPDSMLRKTITSLLCNVLNDFPGSGWGGIFIQIFKGFQGNSFRTKYFIKRKGKRGEDPNKIYTRRAVLRNLNEIMSLQTRKWPNSLLSPAHYFSSLSLLAIFASFGWGHPEPSRSCQHILTVTPPTLATATDSGRLNLTLQVSFLWRGISLTRKLVTFQVDMVNAFKHVWALTPAIKISQVSCLTPDPCTHTAQVNIIRTQIKFLMLPNIAKKKQTNKLLRGHSKKIQ